MGSNPAKEISAVIYAVSIKRVSLGGNMWAFDKSKAHIVSKSYSLGDYICSLWGSASIYHMRIYPDSSQNINFFVYWAGTFDWNQHETNTAFSSD